MHQASSITQSLPHNGIMQVDLTSFQHVSLLIPHLTFAAHGCACHVCFRVLQMDEMLLLLKSTTVPACPY